MCSIGKSVASSKSCAWRTRKRRQLGVTVLRDQQIHLQPATALAAGARDLEHRDPGGKIAERDRTASHRCPQRHQLRRGGGAAAEVATVSDLARRSASTI